MSHNEKDRNTTDSSESDVIGNDENVTIIRTNDIKELIKCLCNESKRSTEILVEQFKKSNEEMTNSLRETINNGFGDVCDTLKNINADGKQHYNTITEEIQKLNKTLQEDIQLSISSSFDKLITNQKNNIAISNNAEGRFNNLDAVTQQHEGNNTIKDDLSPDERKQINKNLNCRKMKFYQTHRAETLSKYYRSLIERDIPFVPHKFRTNINGDARDGEKQIRKEVSINNVENECRILEQNIKDWKEEMEELEIQTRNIIKTITINERSEQLQVKWNADKQAEEIKSIDIWQQHMNKITSSYNREINSGAECTVNIIKPKPINPINHSEGDFRYHHQNRHRYKQNRQHKREFWAPEYPQRY